MDNTDPAWKVAEAAFAAVRGDPDAVGKAFADLKPTTRTVSQAYAICLTTAPFSGTEATRLMLNTLQFMLAEQSARRLNVLNAWIAWLTGLVAAFGIIDVALRLRGL
jgi:hypothetical protein